MRKSDIIYKLAEQLLYRDLAHQHQFWYREEDRPLLEKNKDKEEYIIDAKRLFRVIDTIMIPPLALIQIPSVVKDKTIGKYLYQWEPEDEEK